MSRTPRIRRPALRSSACIKVPRAGLLPQMLEGVDALVYDIQDVGARFYTYSCTMLYSMEDAAKKHLPFYVLDRPNPITGVHVEGPMLDRDLESFVGCFEIPLRHGMTFGELATMANGERNLGLDLHVVPMQGWDRGDWFDSTGLPWVNPSPNMRSLNAATALSRRRDAGSIQELFGWPRHGRPVRASRRRLDPWPRAGRVSEWPLHSWRSRLSHSLQPNVLEFLRPTRSKAFVSSSRIAMRLTAPGLVWSLATLWRNSILARSLGTRTGF